MVAAGTTIPRAHLHPRSSGRSAEQKFVRVRQFQPNVLKAPAILSSTECRPQPGAVVFEDASVGDQDPITACK